VLSGLGDLQSMEPALSVLLRLRQNISTAPALATAAATFAHLDFMTTPFDRRLAALSAWASVEDHST
jgi:hypothetical protein